MTELTFKDLRIERHRATLRLYDATLSKCYLEAVSVACVAVGGRQRLYTASYYVILLAIYYNLLKACQEARKLRQTNPKERTTLEKFRLLLSAEVSNGCRAIQSTYKTTTKTSLHLCKFPQVSALQLLKSACVKSIPPTVKDNRTNIQIIYETTKH